MPKSTLRLATPADDPALRNLLRASPMPGSISLSYEREPDYFITAGMEGSLSQTVVNVENETGVILGTGTRVILPMYLNGQVRETGYFGHLRVNFERPWGLSFGRELARSFRKMHDLHADGRAPFYLMSVISDNSPARRILTSDLPGMPHARPYTRMFTYAIAPRQLRREIPLPKGLQLGRGTTELIPEILACLQRSGQQKQFSPVWSSETTFSPTRTPNLRPEDFLVALSGSRVLGCLALWDQTSFKQTVVRGYSGGMARMRPLINWLARFIDLPHLPKMGEQIPYCFASHLAIDHDDAGVFASLLRAAYNGTIRKGFHYFMLGLAESHPFRPLLTRNYLHITYSSQIYLMAWDDGLDAVARVDNRIPGLEIAVL